MAWLHRDSVIHRPYFKGDPRIYDHAGLRFLSTLGFRWPRIDGGGSSGDGTGGLADRLSALSDLRRYSGYSVNSSVTLNDRRQKLDRAVKPPPFGLGLKQVADHIVFLINVNGRKGRPPLEAMSRWKADLDWLKRTHYEDQIHSFVWPHLELSDTVRENVEERMSGMEAS